MNPMDMLKNFQDIQAKMSETQEKLRGVTAVGTAGGDMVRVEFNGHMEVRSVKISPEAVDPDDIEMLEDLLLAACTDGITKVKEKIQEEVSGLTGGLDLPPGMFGST